MARRRTPQPAVVSARTLVGNRRASENRLRELGSHIPPPSRDIVHALARERAQRAIRRLVVGAVVGLLALLVGLQWFRPIPSPVYRSALSAFVQLAGKPPALAWPSTGAAALAVAGGGLLGRSGAATAVPVAGLAKVMTAVVVLGDHPLSAGSDGPSMTVGPDVVAAYESEAGEGPSVVPVTVGETLSERQALEGLLVASGNDMGTLLADWDAGTSQAFVAKMNSTARALAMDSTTFRDPSGLDPGTVSTPTDLVHLAVAAMAIPALREIVDMGEVSLPLAGLIYNLDAEVGHDGFVGIKTGTDAVTGGCFLFAAERPVAGQDITLVGVVLGQQTATPTTSALDAAVTLVDSAFATAVSAPLLPPGAVVGHVVAPWGTTLPVEVPPDTTVDGWPGMRLRVQVSDRPLGRSIPAGSQVATLRLAPEGERLQIALRIAARLRGPSVFWRLTRL